MKTLKFLTLFTFGIFFSNQMYGQSCIDSSLINPNMICTEIYDPVCGCDQITYSNACEAEFYFGVSSFTPGPCNPTSCQADFNYVDSACFVEFYGSGASSYEWYFGDGTSSQGAYAFHNYTNSGFFTTCMYAYDSQGVLCDTVCQEIYVQGCGQGNLCDAGFQTWGGAQGCVMEFFGYGAASYEWQFEGSNTIESGSEVSYSFPGDGTYWVLLLAYDGQNQLCDSIYENVTVIGCDSSSNCQADFNYTDSACFVEFYGIGASSYEWYFGDGTSSQGQNAFHNYSSNGLYTVCMYAYDAQGALCDTVCQELYVQGCEPITPCGAGFQYSLDSTCNYTFYAYGAASYEWSYDNMIFSGQTVSMSISPNIIQDLCMYAYDNQGVICDTVCEQFICNSAGLDAIGIQEQTLNVYPNPSSNGYFSIDFEGSITSIKMLDLTGRTVLASVDPVAGTVNASELDAGKYLLQIQSNETTFIEQVLIVE